MLRFVAVLMVCLPALAQNAPEVEQQVSSGLQSPLPQEPQWWRGLGAPGRKALIEQVRKPGSIQMKARAVEALRSFDDAEAREVLKQQAMSAQNPVVRRTAARSFILAQGLKDKSFVERLLHDRDPNLRFRSAQALHALGTPEALKKVDEFIAQEEVPWVVQKLHALRRENVAEARRAKPAGMDPRQ